MEYKDYKITMAVKYIKLHEHDINKHGTIGDMICDLTEDFNFKVERWYRVYYPDGRLQGSYDVEKYTLEGIKRIIDEDNKISRDRLREEEWLAEEEEYLIGISNMLGEKYSNNPNFLEADNYLTAEILKKLGMVTGYKDKPEDIIEIVCSYLGIKEDELLKDLKLYERNKNE